MPDIRPPKIRLEASSHCQLRCPSCPTTSKAIHPVVGSGFLKFEDFRRLLEENPWLPAIELSNYGEIFLNPDLLKMLEFAHARGVALQADNGVNLNHVRPEVLEGVVKYGLRSMTCSIDGATQEAYGQYRVRGHLDRVIGHLRAINDWKARYGSPYPKMTWQFVAFGHNEHEIAAAEALARELGMGFYVKLSWDPEISPLEDGQAVASAVGARTREEFAEKHGVDYMQAICHQLWDAPQINWDGKVLGCCRNFWGDFAAENAFRDGLLPSLNGEKITWAREMLLGRKPAREDIPCTTCTIYLGMRQRGRWLERGAPPLARRVRRFIGRASGLGRVRSWIRQHRAS